MINIKNKKISLSVLLISIVLIIFISILKEKRRFPIYNYGTYSGYKVENIIRFLDIQLNYNNTLFFLFIAVIISILALLFLDDDFIKKSLINLKSIISKLSVKKVFSYSSKVLKVNSVSEQQSEKSQEHIESIKILKIKTNAFVYGYVVIFIQIFLYFVLLKLQCKFSQTLIIIFLISLILRFFSAFKCHEIAYYNKYSSWFWYMFGLIFPAIGLIFAGSESSLKKEYIYIYKYKFSQN